MSALGIEMLPGEAPPFDRAAAFETYQTWTLVSPHNANEGLVQSCFTTIGQLAVDSSIRRELREQAKMTPCGIRGTLHLEGAGEVSSLDCPLLDKLPYVTHGPIVWTARALARLMRWDARQDAMLAGCPIEVTFSF